MIGGNLLEAGNICLSLDDLNLSVSISARGKKCDLGSELREEDKRRRAKKQRQPTCCGYYLERVQCHGRCQADGLFSW